MMMQECIPSDTFWKRKTDKEAHSMMERQLVGDGAQQNRKCWRAVGEKRQWLKDTQLYQWCSDKELKKIK